MEKFPSRVSVKPKDDVDTDTHRVPFHCNTFPVVPPGALAIDVDELMKCSADVVEKKLLTDFQ